PHIPPPSLHDALPICDLARDRRVARELGPYLAAILLTVAAHVDDLAVGAEGRALEQVDRLGDAAADIGLVPDPRPDPGAQRVEEDRKSTRLNSSHQII